MFGGLGSLAEDCGNTFRNSGTPSTSSSLAAFDAVAAARIAPPGRAGARLGELLVSEGLVTPGEVKRALTDQRKTGRRLGEIIFERGLASVPTLVRVLARQLEVELETEKGYGAGLRGAIEERHRVMRGRQSGSVNGRSESVLQHMGQEGLHGEGET